MPFSLAIKSHWEIKGRFRKRVVLANVPSFRFSFRGNIRRNHPFGNHPFGNHPFVNTKKGHWEIKGRFPKGWFWRTCPRSRFRSGGTSAETTLLETTLLRTPEKGSETCPKISGQKLEGSFYRGSFWQRGLGSGSGGWWGVVSLWKMREKGKGVGRVGGGCGYARRGKSMSMLLSILPFSKLPFSFSPKFEAPLLLLNTIAMIGDKIITYRFLLFRGIIFGNYYREL